MNKQNKKTKLHIILSHTCTYFNFLNLCLAALIILSGQYKNMLFLGIVISNSLIGIMQELKVKKLIDKLSIITAAKARKIDASSRIQEIPVENIETGDNLRILAGDQIVADAIVISSDGLEVNESLLTGESVPVLKKAGDSLLSGSHAVAGRCDCRVIHTGEENYAEKILNRTRSKKRASSEMQNSIQKIIRYVSYAIVPVGALLFYIQYFYTHASLSDSLVSTVAGVLGMIPEGLVLLTSISFILGVGRLARKQALVQEMEAIEALARTDILCVDKTGTITSGNLFVTQIDALNNKKKENVTSILATLLFAFEDDNATSSAIKKYLVKNGSVSSIDTHKITKKFPFSSRRKFMGITINDEVSYILGAPDFLTNDQFILSNSNKYGKSGIRVLLLASCKALADTPDALVDIKPIALICLADEIKPDAPEIFEFFRNRNVAVKIISGDNPATVSAVGIHAGIPEAANHIDASSLENCSEDELLRIAENYTVFGRVSPEMKERLVHACQKAGHVVSMTGDGVNDVLALKEADCGIAMANGADAAKQAAHIILLNSDFASMKDIVKEGRTIISNIERVSALYLTKTIYSILLCVIFIFLGKSYPFIPIQLSLIGAAAIGIPSFILTLETHDTVRSGGFLKHVLRISLPAALLLTATLIILQFLANSFGFSSLFLRTLNILAGGIISIGVVIRVCLPMNRTRFALCCFISLLFFGALFLLPNLFDVVSLQNFF